MTHLYIDQFGNKFYADTVKELREKVGGGSISKMYIDRKGETYHVGYVIGPHWLSKFAPVEEKA